MTICKGCIVFEPIVLIRGIGHWKKKTNKCELCGLKLNNELEKQERLLSKHHKQLIKEFSQLGGQGK